MIRLLGFLIGSATSVGLILLILGVPDINLSNQLVNTENKEAALQTVEEEITNFKVIAEEILDDITDETGGNVTKVVSEFVEELSPAKIPIEPSEPAGESPPAELPTEPSKLAGELATAAEPQVADIPLDPPNESANDSLIADDQKWHAFWTPFRSRIAAEGFVGQLEKVTGLDYRVIKTKTAVYEVAFGYEDDAERRDKMSLIASATGLDLPQS